MTRFTSTRVIVRSVPSGQDIRALAHELGVSASSAVPLVDLECMVQSALTTLADDLAESQDKVFEIEGENTTLTEAATEAQEAEQTTILEVREVIRLFAGAWCAALGVPVIAQPVPVAAPLPVPKRKRARKAA